MTKKLGVLIKQKRKKHGLTQKKLAQKSGISNSFLCEIEKGKASLSLRTLKKIMRALEIDNPIDIF